MNEYKAMKYIGSVSDWLHKRGYTIECSYNAEDQVLLGHKKVTISTRNSPENRLYILLHECGHLLEYNNDSPSYHKKYPLSEPMLMDARKKYSIRGRVEIVEEEINAWKKGEKLADRLGFKMDKERYRKYAAKQVITYIDWAADRSRN